MVKIFFNISSKNNITLIGITLRIFPLIEFIKLEIVLIKNFFYKLLIEQMSIKLGTFALLDLSSP